MIFSCYVRKNYEISKKKYPNTSIRNTKGRYAHCCRYAMQCVSTTINNKTIIDNNEIKNHDTLQK